MRENVLPEVPGQVGRPTSDARPATISRVRPRLGRGRTKQGSPDVRSCHIPRQSGRSLAPTGGAGNAKPSKNNIDHSPAFAGSFPFFDDLRINLADSCPEFGRGDGSRTVSERPFAVGGIDVVLGDCGSSGNGGFDVFDPSQDVVCVFFSLQNRFPDRTGMRSRQRTTLTIRRRLPEPSRSSTISG